MSRLIDKIKCLVNSYEQDKEKFDEHFVNNLETCINEYKKKIINLNVFYVII